MNIASSGFCWSPKLNFYKQADEAYKFHISGGDGNLQVTCFDNGKPLIECDWNGDPATTDLIHNRFAIVIPAVHERGWWFFEGEWRGREGKLMKMLLAGPWNRGFECGITVAVSTEFRTAGLLSKQFTSFHFSLEHSLRVSPSFAPVMLLGIYCLLRQWIHFLGALE